VWAKVIRTISQCYKGSHTYLEAGMAVSRQHIITSVCLGGRGKNSPSIVDFLIHIVTRLPNYKALISLPYSLKMFICLIELTACWLGTTCSAAFLSARCGMDVALTNPVYICADMNSTLYNLFNNLQCSQQTTHCLNGK
jgi:hypothetical protein